MCEYLLEACVETLREAQIAEKKGAHRIELCANLDKDGLTPPINLLKSLQKHLHIPIKVMIRPRPGDFEYNNEEISNILESITLFKENGADNIVFGAIKNNRLDMALIQIVARHAFPIKITIHKAIDQSNDIESDISRLKSVPNIESILSSGGAQRAIDAIERLKIINEACWPELELLVAGKVTQHNLAFLQSQIGAKAYHGRKIMEL